MPEGYTHIRIGEGALEKAGLAVADKAAFGCGANGPDLLFCYRAWRRPAKRGEDLPALGDRLHRENTGAFLQSLLENAKTESQKSYTLGFLSHYAADCVLHPYIEYLCQKDQPYHRKGGHAYAEIAIDSFLHQKDTGKATVPVDHSTPKLAGAPLAEVGALLEKGMDAALDVKVSREALADAFWHTRLLRRCFCSPLRIGYAVFWLAEPFLGGRGHITGHITPAALAGTKPGSRPLPSRWKNPFTGEAESEDLMDLLEKAERRSAAYLLAADAYWRQSLELSGVMKLLGSASYQTGLPDEVSSPKTKEAMAGEGPA